FTTPRYPVCVCDARSHSDIHTLSLHDALPIYVVLGVREEDRARRDDLDRAGRARERVAVSDEEDGPGGVAEEPARDQVGDRDVVDRKSTRLNSSHVKISYAVFCLKQK